MGIDQTGLLDNMIMSGSPGSASGVRSTLLLDAPLQAGFTLAKGQGTYTAARASTDTVGDYEGIVRTVPSGCGCFRGGRFVQNLLSATEDLSDAAWSAYRASITSGVSDPDGGTSAYTITATSTLGIYREEGISTVIGPAITSMWMRRRNGTGNIALYKLQSNNSTLVTLTSEWQRFTTTGTATGTDMFGVDISTSGDAIDVWHPQAESALGRSDTTTPSEYISVGAGDDHGSNVDGVKWFTTKNGNSVTDNVVTEGVGAAIGASDYYADADGPHGYQSQAGGTNICLHSKTYENAVWVATNVTKSDNDVVGVFGTVTASTLTATAANGTVIQDLGTISSAQHTGGTWIKRKTGTGNIDLTLDGGSTWTTVAVDSTWQRLPITQTLADPDYGIRIVTSGDAIYVDTSQVETGSHLTSDQVTTTIAASRAAQTNSYPTLGNTSSPAMSITMDWVPDGDSLGTVFLWGSYVDASNYTAILHDGTNIIVRKRISGINTDATKALNYSGGTLYSIGATFGSSGQQVYVDGVAGTPHANTDALQLGADFEIGSDGNSANQADGTYRLIKIHNKELSASEIASA